MEKYNKKTSKPHKKNAVKALLFILAAVAFVALCFGGYTYIMLNSMKSDQVEVISKPTPSVVSTPEPAPSLAPVEGTPDDINEDHEDSVDPDQIETDPIYDLGTLDENVINILILGEDIRPGETGQGRSDTIMLLSYDTQRNTAKLVSFLRDTYLHIPERNTWNRINTAYRFGGVGLAINTINENFGLDIKYYIITDFVNLEKIINALGGLELDITAKEASFINSYTGNTSLPEEKGTYLLSGQQVLAHCRNRKTGDGDWGRTMRQRQVMLALFNRAKQERNVGTLAELANNLLQYVRTNLDAGMLLQLGVKAVFSDGFSLTGGTVPFEDTWRYAKVGNASVIQIDLEKNKTLLHELLYGEGDLGND